MKAVPLIVGVALLLCLLDSIQGQNKTNATTSTTAAPIATASIIAAPIATASKTATPIAGSVSPVATTNANVTQGGNSGSQRISFTPFSVFIMAIFFAIANFAGA